MGYRGSFVLAIYRDTSSICEKITYLNKVLGKDTVGDIEKGEAVVVTRGMENRLIGCF